MQLTARQREFAAIAVWALPVSITLGAIFGHFQAPSGSVWGYIQGAVTAILISCTIFLLEFAVFSRARNALARRVPFLLYLALRSLGYLAAILMGLAVGAWLIRESAESAPLIERGGIIFSLVLSLGFNLLFGVNELLGQGVLFNFVAGRYHRPRVEERVLLFIDMESSTVIAERLGELASSIFSTASSPTSPTRLWRSAARSTNMSATRSSSPGRFRWPSGRALRARLLRRAGALGRAR